MKIAWVLAAAMAVVLAAIAALVIAGQLRDRGGSSWTVVDGQGAPVGSGRFTNAEAFASGLAAVEVDGRWGYVDTQGELVIPARFTRAGPFEGETAIAEDGLAVGVIDRTGAWVLNPEWRRVEGVADGVAVVASVVGTRTSRISAPEPDLSAGLVRLDGTRLVTPADPGTAGRWLEARGPQDGRIAVRLDDGWHLVGLDGQVLAPRFDDLRAPHDGLAAAQIGGRWGYVDRAGAIVIEPRWTWAGDFAAGRAVVEDGDGWRILDAAGQVLGTRSFQLLHRFSEGRAPAQDTDGRWGFVGTDGEWALPPRWAKVGEEGFRAGRARVAQVDGLDYSWAWIDNAGAELGGRRYRAILPFDGDRALARP